METTENFNQSLKLLYPTPILQHQFKDSASLNNELKNILLKKEQDNPQLRTEEGKKSNIAGWRSKEDLLSWPDSCVKSLAQRVAKAVNGLTAAAPIKGTVQNKRINMYAWANINRRGSYNISHVHPGQHWAAVYYVATGETSVDRPRSGQLELQDPRPAASAMKVPGFEFGQNFSIQPEPGMLIVFPAWLSHFVHPLEGEAERISIAFNIRLEND